MIQIIYTKTQKKAKHTHTTKNVSNFTGEGEKGDLKHFCGAVVFKCCGQKTGRVSCSAYFVFSWLWMYRFCFWFLDLVQGTGGVRREGETDPNNFSKGELNHVCGVCCWFWVGFCFVVFVVGFGLVFVSDMCGVPFRFCVLFQLSTFNVFPILKLEFGVGPKVLAPVVGPNT